MGQSTDGVGKFLERFAEAWESNDGQALADAFVEDGSLINPFGRRADGREGVAAMYSEYFAGMLGGTSSTIRVESIRPVDHRYALADAEQIIRGGNGDVLLVVHLAALLRRDGDDWHFVDSRPYTFAATPA